MGNATDAPYAGGDPVTELAAVVEHRSHQRLVAHRLLGSATEADDAVQEAWLKLARVATSAAPGGTGRTRFHGIGRGTRAR